MSKTRTIAILATLLLGLPFASAANTPFPDFAAVERLVNEHFEPSYDFHQGDLITKSDVAPVLKKLSTIGWQVKDTQSILDRVLDDNDYLVRQLRSPNGRRLYNEVARYPGALDRLDRMRDMQGGQKTLDTFVQKTRGNADVMKTVLTTKRGQRFANDIAKFDNGRDFNKPTKRIYRVQELVPALKELHEKEKAELGAPTSHQY